MVGRLCSLVTFVLLHQACGFRRLQRSKVSAEQKALVSHRHGRMYTMGKDVDLERLLGETGLHFSSLRQDRSSTLNAEAIWLRHKRSPWVTKWLESFLRRRQPSPQLSMAPVDSEEVAAQKECPKLHIVDDWSDPSLLAKSRTCIMGKTFGCEKEGSSVWTRGSCGGLFSVGEKHTVCGMKGPSTCVAGTMPPPTHQCGLMLLTTYFTTKKDWQRGNIRAKADYGKIRHLYHSAVPKGINVTVLYDQLPSDFVQRYSNDRFQFHQVDLKEVDSRYGVNDVRYFFYLKLLEQHPDWKNIFLIDAFDVQVPLNPCPGIEDGKLYVGHEPHRIHRHPWMRARYMQMGGRYLSWFLHVPQKLKILNCGITGGRREVVLSLVKRMTEVLSDKNLAARRKPRQEIDLNMPALNYVVYNEFQNFVTGTPVNSVFGRFQTHRQNVWFIHK